MLSQHSTADIWCSKNNNKARDIEIKSDLKQNMQTLNQSETDHIRIALTHQGRVTHMCVSKISCHWLNDGWLVINCHLTNILQCNINKNAMIYIEENTFEMIVCRISVILFQPEVASMLMSSTPKPDIMCLLLCMLMLTSKLSRDMPTNRTNFRTAFRKRMLMIQYETDI